MCLGFFKIIEKKLLFPLDKSSAHQSVPAPQWWRTPSKARPPSPGPDDGPTTCDRQPLECMCETTRRTSRTATTRSWNHWWKRLPRHPALDPRPGNENAPDTQTESHVRNCCCFFLVYRFHKLWTLYPPTLVFHIFTTNHIVICVITFPSRVSKFSQCDYPDWLLFILRFSFLFICQHHINTQHVFRGRNRSLLRWRRWRWSWWWSWSRADGPLDGPSAIRRSVVSSHTFYTLRCLLIFRSHTKLLFS